MSQPCEARLYPLISGRRLRVLQQELDRRIDLQNAHVAELGSPTRCTRGCDGCCYNWVDALPEEARAILDAVRERGGEEAVAALLAAAKEHVAAARKVASGEAWFRLRRPCLFLQGGACSIYEHRPFTCRAYHVVSDPADCSPDRPGQEVRRVNHLHAMRLYLDHFGAPTDFLPALLVAEAEDKAVWS